MPRKPHPFGNEYHSISDAATEKGLEGKPIMWRVKIQEGKDRPQEAEWELGIPLRVSWLLKNSDTDAGDDQAFAPHRKGHLHGQWVLCFGWHNLNAQFWCVRSVTN